MTTNIWKEFNQQLLRFIKARVNNAETAEDILQEVFIKIHKSVHKVRDDKKIASWIYQITRNSIIDHYRKKKVDSTTLNFEEFLPEEINKSVIDFTKCVKPFILQLPEKYKDVLLKTTYAKISQKDYALQNSLSYSATKSRVQRGRQQLNELFNQCCTIEADKYGNVLSASNRNCDC